MITIDPNYQFSVLDAGQVRRLNIAEGAGYGNSILAQLLDQALAASADPLPSAQIIVGNASGVAKAVAMSGQATISNTGVITLSNSAVIAKVLTGYAAGAGVVASTDSILAALQKVDGNNLVAQNGQFTPQSEAVIAAGPLSAVKMLSTVSNVTSGSYAATLAAPSGQDGQIKIIKAIATMTHTVTLAMTNIAMSGGYTPAGSTTLTFTSAGDSAILMAVGAKWVYLGGTAVRVNCGFCEPSEQSEFCWPACTQWRRP